MKFIRKDAVTANNGGQFLHADGSYTDLYWYAKAVGVMKSRPISDATSWWFYAAIHGQYLIYDRSSGYAPSGYPNWGMVKSIPAAANLGKLPSQEQTDLFWNQCQHSTWFFPPWHRGYLVAIENILRDIIESFDNAPKDWALPYWNYLPISDTEQKFYKSNILPVFSALTLPDGSDNPLYVPERYGPNSDNNNVYIPVGVADDDNDEYITNDSCQFDNIFTTPVTRQEIGYGGLKTGFVHYGRGGAGKLESNPHNHVHNFIGGQVDMAEAVSFTVEANQSWQSTGINIQSDSNVYIEANRKKSKGWTADPKDNKGKLYGIAGSPDIKVSPSQPLYPVVNVPLGALVGRVNGGTPFLITDGSAISGNLNGVLEFCINDDITGAYGAGLTDNQGSITLDLYGISTEEFEGLMSDPGVAALDPVFYIHHANIDRLWAAWNETGNNENSDDTDWLEGPTVYDKSQFAMPMDAKGTPWYYQPKDVNTTTINIFGNPDNSYEYTYDNLVLTTYSTKPSAVLIAAVDKTSVTMSKRKSDDLIGGGDPFSLDNGITETSVQFDKKSLKSVKKNFLGDSSTHDELYLQLEDVKGTNNANFLSVFVNDVFIDSVSLFGIRLASMNEHGGEGLTFRFNISHLAGMIDENNLNVRIKTRNTKMGEISVGGIRIYRVKQ